MKKYFIAMSPGYGEGGRNFETDSPTTAVNKWLTYSLKRPSMVKIWCGSIEDCIAVYQDFLSRRNEIYSKYWVEHGMRHNFGYIVDSCNYYLSGSGAILEYSFLGTSSRYDCIPLFS